MEWKDIDGESKGASERAGRAYILSQAGEAVGVVDMRTCGHVAQAATLEQKGKKALAQGPAPIAQSRSHRAMTPGELTGGHDDGRRRQKTWAPKIGRCNLSRSCRVAEHAAAISAFGPSTADMDVDVDMDMDIAIRT
jgi:hypothetical protein